MLTATQFQQAAVCCFTFLCNKTFTIQIDSVLSLLQYDIYSMEVRAASTDAQT
jgi:hypothetical protein